MKLRQLQDVKNVVPSNNQLFRYDAATGKWGPATVTPGDIGAVAKTGDSMSGALDVSIYSAGGGGEHFLMTRYGTHSGAPLLVGRKARGTSSSPADVAVNDSLASMSAHGWFNNGWRQSAMITADVDAAPSGTAVPGRLRMFTAGTSGTLAERMRIDSNGVVSIGDVSPSAHPMLYVLKTYSGSPPSFPAYTPEQIAVFSNAGTNSAVSILADRTLAAWLSFSDQDHRNAVMLRVDHLYDTFGLFIQSDLKMLVQPTGRVGFGTGFDVPPSQVYIRPHTASIPALVLKALGGQSSDLLQVRDAGDVRRFYIRSDGYASLSGVKAAFTAGSYTRSAWDGYIVLYRESDGATLYIPTLTAAPF
jgi:hypothetical protein